MRKLIGYILKVERQGHYYANLNVDLLVDNGYKNTVIPEMVGSLRWQTDSGRKEGDNVWYAMEIKPAYDSSRHPDRLAEFASLVKKLTFKDCGHGNGTKYFAADNKPEVVIENIKKARAERMVYDSRSYGYVSFKERKGSNWGKWLVDVPEKEGFYSGLSAGTVWARDEDEARRLLLVEVAGQRNTPEKSVAYFVECGMPVKLVQSAGTLEEYKADAEFLKPFFDLLPADKPAETAAVAA